MKGVQFIVLNTVSGKTIKKRIGKVWIGKDNKVHIDVKGSHLLKGLFTGIPDPVTRKILTSKDGINFMYAIPHAYSGTYGWAEYVDIDEEGNILDNNNIQEGD